MTIDNRISTKSRQIGLELYLSLINIDKGLIENKKKKRLLQFNSKKVILISDRSSGPTEIK